MTTDTAYENLLNRYRVQLRQSCEETLQRRNSSLMPFVMIGGVTGSAALLSIQADWLVAAGLGLCSAMCFVCAGMVLYETRQARRTLANLDAGRL